MPLLPHHPVVIPQVHACDILNPLPQELKHIVDFLLIQFKRAILAVYCFFRCNKPPDYSFIPTLPPGNQIRALVASLLPMKTFKCSSYPSSRCGTISLTTFSNIFSTIKNSPPSIFILG